MTILITGGTGQTGLVLARLLHNANHDVLITSRSGIAPAPFKAVTFDWFNHSTFENPFNLDPNIDKVYVVAPPGLDRAPHMLPFIDLAISKGVKRLVLLSYVGTGPGNGPIEGIRGVHEYLTGRGVDYVVLQGSWFIENFQTSYLHSIRDRNIIESIIGDEKVPFVTAEDIADFALEALTVEPSPNTDWYILGPELLTYDEVSNIFSEVLGRKITHQRLSEEEEHTRWVSMGISHEYADEFVRIEKLTAEGLDAKLATNPDTKFGKRSLREVVEANKAVWQVN